MQQGVLYFERQTERMDIHFENKEILWRPALRNYNGGLDK